MQVNIRESGQNIVITLNGRFVFEARHVFQKAITEAQDKPSKKVLINMEKVTYLDSAGLGLLALGFEQAKAQNKELCLVNPTGAVKEIIRLTHLQKLVNIYDTEEQASSASSPANVCAT